AIQAIGAIYHRQGRPDEALRFYPEALRVASAENGHDLLTDLLVRLEICCIRSETGDNQGALADYERLYPLVRTVSRQHPLYFYFYHNELAVEFGELGRIAEAEAACKIALASPFAHAYPEWSETRQELQAKRTSATPSVVAINREPEPEPNPQIEAQRQPEPAAQIQTQRQLERSTVLGLSWPRERVSFQRSVIPLPAKPLIVFNTASILDRVLNSIGPRAPPARP